MEATLFAILAFVALLAIVGAIAAIASNDTREGFAPYSAGA